MEKRKTTKENKRNKRTKKTKEGAEYVRSHGLMARVKGWRYHVVIVSVTVPQKVMTKMITNWTRMVRIAWNTTQACISNVFLMSRINSPYIRKTSSQSKCVDVSTNATVSALNLQRCSLKCVYKEHILYIMTVYGEAQRNCEYENFSSLSTKNTLNVTSAPWRGA